MRRPRVGRRLAWALVLCLALCGGGKRASLPAVAAMARTGGTQAIQSPTLKWQRGGCYSSWCETGWYSSPAVADLDGDGTAEVIAGAYTLFILNGEDGTLQKSVSTPGGRVWPGVVVADLDANGFPELVIAQGGGYLTVLDRAGGEVWGRRPAESELRGLSVYDLDGDGTLEIVVTGAISSKTNTWVYEHDGTLRAGWPQLSNDSGYAWGVYNDNAAVGDLDGDSQGEIVVPSDVHYICAYESGGTQIPANAIYGGKGWGKVGVWESPETELRGWGTCTVGDDRAERYRANFAHGPAAIADMNGDGAMEVAAVGNVYDCISGYPSRYTGPYLFNADRSRFNAGGYDWRNPPVDTGAPLTEDYGVIENCQPNPAVADLDGDGRQEMVFASYDGRVHAFWLDKTEHGHWPYAVYTSGPYRFASEPAIADLDDDGHAEVVFTSWVQKGSYQTGKLHVLTWDGQMLYEVSLPPAFGSPDWNGALAAPTLANIDADADLEVVVNTAHSGVVAYDLPGTAGARILWGTGRGNYQRTGSSLHGSLGSSTKTASPALPALGDVVTYTITLRNPGPSLAGVQVTDTLPAGVHYAGGLWASAGSAHEAGGTITWSGDVPAAEPVTIRFGAAVDAAQPQVVINRALLDDGLGNVLERQAEIVTNGWALYLPASWKGYAAGQR